MNRIEDRLAQLKEKKEKAFITYMTAGLPNMEHCKELIKAQQEAGCDIVEIGVPFSDPIADGPVIQDASYRSIQLGTDLASTFDLVAAARAEGVTMPLVFMMYSNTIFHYGMEAFFEKCEEVGIDGIIVPDIPYEEQEAFRKLLAKKESPIMIQLVSPVSGDRIPMLLENARGFVYCVSSMGVTGQPGAFHKKIKDYLASVKAQADIPVMMGFGIRTAADVAPLQEQIDGAIVGSHFISLMESCGYDLETAKDYIRTFKKQMQEQEK